MDSITNRKKQRQEGIKSILDRQSKQIRSPSWYGGFERLHHSVTNRKEKKDLDLGSKRNKGKRTIRSRIKFRMQPNPNPREEHRPARPNCRAVQSRGTAAWEGHESRRFAGRPPLSRGTESRAAIAWNRGHAQARAQERNQYSNRKRKANIEP